MKETQKNNDFGDSDFQIISRDDSHVFFQIISRDDLDQEKDGWLTAKLVKGAEWFGWGAGIYVGQVIIPGLAAQVGRAAAVAGVDAGIKATPLIGRMIGYATANSSVANSIYHSTVLTPLAEKLGYEAYGCALNPGQKVLTFLGSNTILGVGVFGEIGSKICGATAYYIIKTTECVASKTYEGTGYVASKTYEGTGYVASKTYERVKKAAECVASKTYEGTGYVASKTYERVKSFWTDKVQKSPKPTCVLAV
jgi:hypothetical protein